jgi:hypothetical protein
MASLPPGSNVAGASGKAQFASMAVPSDIAKPGSTPAPLRQAVATKSQYHVGPRCDCAGGNMGGQGARKRYL